MLGVDFWKKLYLNNKNWNMSLFCSVLLKIWKFRKNNLRRLIINMQKVRTFQIMTAIEKISPTHSHLNQCLDGNTHKGYDFNGNHLFDHCALEYLWLLSFGNLACRCLNEPEELGSCSFQSWFKSIFIIISWNNFTNSFRPIVQCTHRWDHASIWPKLGILNIFWDGMGWT